MSDADDINAWLQQDRKARVGGAVVGTRATPSDAAARANALARQLGIPPETVERNAADVQARKRAAEVQDVVGGGNDYLQRWYGNPRNAAAGRDDAEKLRNITDLSGSLGEIARRNNRTVQNRDPGIVRGLWNDFWVGVGKVQEGLKVARADNRDEQVNQLDRVAGLTGNTSDKNQKDRDEALARIAQYDQFQQNNRIEDEPWWYGGVSSFVQQLPGLAASIVTRSPVASLGYAGGQTYGQAYGKYRARGATAAQARQGAMGEGGTEIATELLPAQKFLSGLFAKSGKKALKDLAVGIAADIPGEQIATLVQDAFDTAIANPDKTWADYWKERPKAAADTFLATIVQGGITGGLGMAGNHVIRRAEARQGARVLDAFMADSAEATMRQHDPEGFRDFVAGATEGTAMENVFLPGEKVRELMQEGYESDPFWGRYADQIEEAATLGGDVVIPMADAATFLAGTPEWDSLKDEARFSPGGVSMNELAEVEQRLKDGVSQLPGQIESAVDEATAKAAPMAQIYDEMNQKLRSVGYAPDVAGFYAQAWAESMVADATQFGVDPLEYYRQNPIEVQQVLPQNLAAVRAVDSVPAAIEAMRARGAATVDPVFAKAAGPKAIEARRQLRIERHAILPEGALDDQTIDDIKGGAAAQFLDSRGDLIKVAYADGRYHVESGGGVSYAARADLVNFAKNGDWRAITERADPSADQTRAAANELATILEDAGIDPMTASDADITKALDAYAKEQENAQGRGLLEQTRDRGRPEESDRTAPLEGAPAVQGFHGPVAAIVAAAEAYARKAGIDLRRQAEYVQINPKFSKRIADAYEAMEHNPSDPKVQEAYRAMVEQTRAQYDALVEAGFTFYFVDPNEASSNPFDFMRELREEKRLGVFSTEAGFGSDAAFDPSQSPLLEDTGLTWPGPDGKPMRVLANDVFRAVHDAFGHGLEGAGFRARGEENAWQAHARLYTGAAIGAMTSETRGQNSWLNFGPYGEANQTASVEDTHFADQKTGLMPEWTWLEGRAPDEGTVVVGEDGKPGLVFHGTPFEFEQFQSKGKAVWFSEGEGLAKQYADPRRWRKRGEGRVIKARLYVQHPLEIPPEIVGNTDSGAAWAMDNFGFDLRAHGWERVGSEYTHDVVRSSAFAEAAREAGYDAIIQREQGVTTWGVLKRGAVISEDRRVMLQPAWHGGARFDRFSTAFIGTGEGQQAYGWGLYFAGHQDVAEYYRQKVTAQWKSGDEIKWGGRTALDRYQDADRKGEYGKLVVLERILLHQPKAVIEDYLAEGVAEGERQSIEAKAYLDSLPDDAFADVGGQLYEVEIPEDSEFLRWDRPISDQPGVADALRKAGVEVVSEGKYPDTGADVYQRLSRELGSDREASTLLREAGFAGIRYFDAQSRDRGQGTSNYVVFDDSRVEIKRTLFQQSPEAAWTGQRIARLLDQYAVGHDETKTKSFVASVSPQQFIDVTTPADRQEELRNEAGTLDEGRLAGETQTPFLIVDGADLESGVWRVIGHEGRHRMAALAKAGVEQVPVVVQVSGIPWSDLQQRDQMTILTAQQHSENLRGAKNIIIDRMVPLTYANKAQIKSEFGRPDARVLFQESEDETSPVASLADARERRELRGFHSDLQGQIAERMQQHGDLIADLRAEGKLPLDIGTRILTPKAKETGQPPWVITGYTVNPKTPDRYGYTVERGPFETEDGPTMEKSSLMVSDPASDARMVKHTPGWDRAKEVASWTVMGGPRTLFQQELQAGVFYSALGRAVDAVKAEKAPAAQWLATIKNAPGVKAEEIEWSGLEEFLAAQTGPLLKADLQAFLKAGGIRIEEVVLGAADPDEVQEILDEKRQAIEDRFDDQWDGGSYYVEQVDEDEDGEPLDEPKWKVSFQDDLYDTEDEAQEVADELNSEEEREARDSFVDSSFYEELVREDLEEELRTSKYHDYSSDDTSDTYKELLITLPAYIGNNPRTSPGTHWDESGVVVHARFMDKKGPNGEKILFIEEVQSDWHQQARERASNAKEQFVKDWQHLIERAVGTADSEEYDRVMAEYQKARDGDDLLSFYPKLADMIRALPDDENDIKDAQHALKQVERLGDGYDAGVDQAAVDAAKAAEEQAMEVYNAATHDTAVVKNEITAFIRERADQVIDWAIEQRIEQVIAENPDLAGDEKALDEQRTLTRRSVTASSSLGEFKSTGTASTGMIRDADLYVKKWLEATATLDERSDYRQMIERLDDKIEAEEQARGRWNLRVQEGRRLHNSEGVPNAPFKTTYPDLIMKRLIAWAAEGDYDQVAWIKSGENNGGWDDNVGWFYERNLPNIVNKLLKKHGGKGASEAEIAASRAARDEAIAAANRDMNAAQAKIKTLYSEHRINNDARGGTYVVVDAERQPLPDDVARELEQAQRDFHDARRAMDAATKMRPLSSGKVRPLVVPGFKAIVTPRMKEIDDRLDVLRKETAGVAKQGGTKEELRQDVAEQVERVQKDRQVHAEDYARFKDIAERLEALPSGEEIEVDGIGYRLSSRDAWNYRNRRDDAATLMERDIALLDKVSDFDSLWPKVEEYRTLMAEFNSAAAQSGTNLGFDITPELKAEAQNGFPLFQGADKGPRGSVTGGLISGDGGPHIVSLFAGRNLSTFIHEMGHIRLEMLRRNALVENAPAAMKADWEALKNWFAQNGVAADDAFISTEAHELWARGFERYAMEGKSPSAALRRAFEGFKAWLLTIYRHVDNLKAPISDEVRGVMDRLFATQEAIDDMREEQKATALFTDAAQAGMTETEFAAYQKEVAAARSEANDALLYKTMATIRAQRTKGWKDAERSVRADVTSSVNAMPEFRALHLLRTGRFIETPDAEPIRVKLDSAWLVATYGEGVFDTLPKSVPPIYAEQGEDADMIANLAGFRSGDEMIRTLIAVEQARKDMREAGDKRSVARRMIDEQTAAQMHERFGDPLSDGSIEEEALAAISNDRQAEVIASEGRALARQRGSNMPTPYRLAREWARRKIAEGKVVEVASRAAIQRYAKASRKAAGLAQDALVKGDIDEAFRQKQAQLLNFALQVEAGKAAEEIDKIVERMGRIAKRRTFKSVDQGYLDRAHALLEKFDFRARSQRAIDEQVSFTEWAMEQQAKGIDVVIPPRLEDQGVHYSRLSYEELSGLADSVDHVMHLGRSKKKLLDAKDERDFDAVIHEMQSQLEGLPQRAPSNRMSPTWFDEKRTQIASADAALLKMETVFDWLDGGDPNGLFNRIVFRRIAEAQHAENDMMADKVGALQELLAALPPETIKRWQERVQLPELLNRETGEPWDMTRDQLIAMALNVGNEGNFDKLAGGFRWPKEVVMQVLERELTADEWQFVQSTWDLIDTLWPEIEALEKRVNGVAPERVEPRTFSVGGVTMRGGYYPVVYDSTKDLTAEKQAAALGDSLFSTAYRRATTPKGFTKERTAVNDRPLLLSLGTINRHIAEVVHDITHREALMDADRFLNDRRTVRAVRQVLGAEVQKQFRPWLQHIANEWAIDRRGVEGWDKVAKTLRVHSTMVGMGLRLTTMLSQVGGYANTMEQIGSRWLGSGFRAVFANGERDQSAVAFVMEKSGEVRHRIQTLERDVNQNIRDLQGRSGLAANVRRFAFYGIAMMDRTVVIPTWLGAYNKGLHEGMTDGDAVAYADKIVRNSQGAGSAKDMAAVQRGSEFMKLATMFYSFASVFYNRQRTFGRDVKAAKPKDMPALLARSWWLFVVSPIIGTMPSALLGSGGPEDDETWAAWALRAMLMGQFMGVPILRDVSNAAVNGFDYAFTPAGRLVDTIIRAGRDTYKLLDQDEETEPSKRAVKTGVEAIGYVTNMPVGQFSNAAQFVADWSNGEVEPDGVKDWLIGLQTGKLPEEKGN